MPGPGLAIELIDHIQPLDSQIGVAQKKTVPDALWGPLFADQAAEAGVPAPPPLNSFAVVDAGKLAGLDEIMQRSRLKIRCLFKGEAEAEMGSVAPWIVQLDDTNAFVRNLFTHGKAMWQLWDKAQCIYIRSRCTIDELQAHLRHFTRIQSHTGSWFYFRFWEPVVATTYFPALADRPEVARRWFHPRKGPSIEALLIPDLTTAPATARVIRPQGLAQVADVAGSRLLSPDDVARLTRARVAADAKALTAELDDAFGSDLPVRGEPLLGLVETALTRFMQAGFRQRDTLFVMLAWEAVFGPGFERIDPEGQLASIMASDRDDEERFDLLKQRMAVLG